MRHTAEVITNGRKTLLGLTFQVTPPAFRELKRLDMNDPFTAAAAAVGLSTLAQFLVEFAKNLPDHVVGHIAGGEAHKTYERLLGSLNENPHKGQLPGNWICSERDTSPVSPAFLSASGGKVSARSASGGELFYHPPRD
jgi:hypothetical protein